MAFTNSIILELRRLTGDVDIIINSPTTSWKFVRLYFFFSFINCFIFILVTVSALKPYFLHPEMFKFPCNKLERNEKNTIIECRNKTRKQSWLLKTFLLLSKYKKLSSRAIRLKLYAYKEWMCFIDATFCRLVYKMDFNEWLTMDKFTLIMSLFP